MNTAKLIQSILVAGAALLALEYLRRLLVKALIRRYEIRSAVSTSILSGFLVSFVFSVMLPAVVYSALYPILPFTSYRSGFFIALFVFGVGQLPFAIRSYNQYRLSSALTALEIGWNLLALLVSLGVITAVYRY